MIIFSGSLMFSAFIRMSWAFGSWLIPTFNACEAKASGIILPDKEAVGVIVGVGEIVIFASSVASGVRLGVGISITVGVGEGVMMVFCCSRVLVMSLSWFLRTADLEYKKTEPEIPIPATRSKIMVIRDPVELLLVGGVVAIVGCRSGAGGFLGINGGINGSLSISFGGGVVGISSGVSSKLGISILLDSMLGVGSFGTTGVIDSSGTLAVCGVGN